MIPEGLTVLRPQKQEKGYKLQRDPRTQLLKETKPKASAFKLLHWQGEAQGSTEGFSNPLHKRGHTRRGSEEGLDELKCGEQEGSWGQPLAVPSYELMEMSTLNSVRGKR